MRRTLGSLGLCLAMASLSGCLAGNQALVRPCCYEGEVALARLMDLDLHLGDGSRLPFERAFPGYRPSAGALALRLPFDEPIRIRRVAYGPLAEVLPAFDFNRNGQLEDPELLVFYVKTAARGFGHDVVDVMAGGRATAIQTSNADIGGLVGYVGANIARLDPDVRTLFTELQFESDVQRRERQGDRAQDHWVEWVPME